MKTKQAILFLASLSILMATAVPPVQAADFVSPTGGEYLRGVVLIQWIRDDPNSEIKLELEVTGSTIEPELCNGNDCPGNSFVLDTTQYADSREYFLKLEEKGIEGNGKEKVTTSGTFTIDNALPSSEAILSGDLGDNGWYVSEVRIQMVAFDETSGVSGVNWELDAGGSQPYVESIVTSAAGLHSFASSAVDRAGNVETAHGFDFKIDLDAPTSSLSIGAPHTDAQRVVYVTSATPLTLSAADATSGVDRIEYRLNEGAFQSYAAPISVSGEDGEYLLEWRAVDAAGNHEETQYQRLSLDDSAPSLDVRRPQPGGIYVDDTVLVETLPAHGEAAGVAADDDASVTTVGFAVAAGDLTVKASSADAASGVARVEFSVDGVLRATDTAAPYEWTWDTRSEILGEHTVEVATFDTLGNTVAASRTVEVIPVGPEGANATVENGGPIVPSFVPGPSVPLSSTDWAAWFGLSP